jgi:hypothetical protein
MSEDNTVVETTSESVDQPVSETTTEEKTFTQAELDAYRDRAIAKQKEQSKAEIEKAVKEAVKKQDGLRDLSEDQRKAKELEEKIEEADQRERLLNYRELNTDLKVVLAEKDLPIELADPLSNIDIDKKDILETINKIEQVVSDRVNERVKVNARQSDLKTPETDLTDSKPNDAKTFADLQRQKFLEENS